MSKTIAEKKFDQYIEEMEKIRQEKIIKRNIWKEEQRIKRIPDPFKMKSYKGFKFLPVLDAKAKIKYTKGDYKNRIIYYNPFFIDPLTRGQKLYFAEGSIRLAKLKNPFKADEAAFYYVHNKFKVSQEEIGRVVTAMSFTSAAHKQDRIFNFVTDSVQTVNRRKRKKAIINFFKSLIPWKNRTA